MVIDMKLFTDETKDIVATQAWVKLKNKTFILPIPELDSENINDESIDLDSIDGDYNLYVTRRENSQLRWYQAGTIAVRVDDDQPLDSDNCENHFCGRINISGLKHDGISITQNPEIKYFKD